ncbi:MAG: glycosyltransferase, partial [Tepidisphaerales bacterium]
VLERLVIPALPITYDLVAQTRPDLIVGTPLSLGARVAHDKLRIPYATVNLAPTIFLSTEAPPHLPFHLAQLPKWLLRGFFRLFDVASDHVIARPVNEFRRAHGLPPVRRILRDYWHSPQLPLCLFPDWFASPDSRIPSDWPASARLTGFVLYDESDVFPLPPELEAFLNAGPPPIVFTPGSAMTRGHDFFAQSLAAVRSLNARAIFLTRCADQLPQGIPSPAPANPAPADAPIVHFPFIPLSKLLPRCAVLVSHGGIGTIAQGLATACPQLVMPMTHDQPDNAQRVANLGAGLVLPRSRYSAARLIPLLRELLDNPIYKHNVRVLAQRIDAGTARSAACAALESLLV